MSMLLDYEHESATAFASLAGFQSWEDARTAIEAGQVLRAELRIVSERQTVFGVGVMRDVAWKYGFHWSLAGTHHTQIVDAATNNTKIAQYEYWELRKRRDDGRRPEQPEMPRQPDDMPLQRISS